ncbi:regulator of nonsense transcripts 2-like [Stegodyphus dumicola]|uniref:regulator of nonsense transcripts 2-like n=1 Tax=Stegodyphus dumicola TaxID=202533 RepID=UPI0015AC76DF|nr:regulator of nonsense transcripts 2-like [Stegodyphus dumicola]
MCGACWDDGCAARHPPQAPTCITKGMEATATPKKDDKRDQLRKQLEEKLLQEELARKEQEEEKLRLEEEKRQKEEEERIRLQEAEARATQSKELEEYVHEVSAAYLNTLTKEWKLKRWNDYLHRTRELDALRLPIINAFLSEWSDDKMYDTKDVFSKVHQCLKVRTRNWL